MIDANTLDWLHTGLKQAESCLLAGNPGEALEAADRCWVVLSRMPASRLHGDCQRIFCWARAECGQTQHAIEACYRSADFYEGANHLAGAAGVLSLGAVCLVRIGDAGEGFALIQRACDLARDLDDPLTEFRIFNNMGILHEVLEEFEKAMTATETAVMVAKRMNNPHALAHLRTSLCFYRIRHALQLRDQGNAEAEALLAHALVDSDAHADTCRTAGHSHMVATLLYGTGLGRLAVGEADLARQALVEGIEVASTARMRPEEANMLRTLAQLESRSGRDDLALACLDRALALSEASGEREAVARCHLQLSELCERAGVLARALAHFRAYHDARVELLRTQAATRAQVLAIRLDNERSRREAMLFRMRSAELEQDNLDLQTHAAQLDRHANEDALTGLSNRRRFDAFVVGLLAPDPSCRSVTFVIADIDHFKRVNDEYSHAVGDRVLQHIGRLFRDQCRPKDLVARFGGEEFVMVLVDVDEHLAYGAAERLRSVVEGFDWSAIQPGLQLTISIGLASCRSAADADATLARADAALYVAKRLGRNRIQANGDAPELLAG